MCLNRTYKTHKTNRTRHVLFVLFVLWVLFRLSARHVFLYAAYVSRLEPGIQSLRSSCADLTTSVSGDQAVKESRVRNHRPHSVAVAHNAMIQRDSEDLPTAVQQCETPEDRAKLRRFAKISHVDKSTINFEFPLRASAGRREQKRWGGQGEGKRKEETAEQEQGEVYHKRNRQGGGPDPSPLPCPFASVRLSVVPPVESDLIETPLGKCHQFAKSELSTIMYPHGRARRPRIG